MAEVIQFNCPACGTMLRLPLGLAAKQGPCPTCQREIIAPDPYRGVGAHEAPPPVLPVEPEPVRPFAETPPLVPKMPEPIAKPPEPEPEIPAPVEPVAPPASEPPQPLQVPPQRAILLLSCLMAGAVGLAVGYRMGVRSHQNFIANPEASRPLVVVPKIEEPPAVVTPTPAVIEPEKVAPVEKPAPPPVKVSAAAEASLRAFLEAPDWAARSAHVLFPEKVRAAMETYSRDVPDGPTVYKSIAVKQSQIDETTGNTLFVFMVVTEKFPGGLPVAIQETPNGWLVDWMTFVEFRDGLFQKFVDGPEDKAGVFHLLVTLPPRERAEKTENENFSSYLIQSPLSDQPLLAYVKKSTPTAATLEAQTMNGRNYAPVLEMIKRKTPDGKNYLEILSVRADDWFPREH